MANTSLREAYGQALARLGAERPDFVCFDADTASGTGAYHFCDAFPGRHFRFGIAEQNMMSAAAGFSTFGIIPVVNTYGVFASMRAAEQIRNFIAYPRFNVKIVSGPAGLDVGPDGVTHQAIEDLSIMRAIPNMVVLAPGDAITMAGAVRAMMDHSGPVYLRTARSPIPSVHHPGHRFEIGTAVQLRSGRDVTIIAIGVMLHRALQAADLLARRGLDARVLDCASVKPLDADAIVACARETGAIVTAEDHSVIGGLGSAVAEVLTSRFCAPLERVGVLDTFAESGSADDLFRKYHLTAEDIAAAAEKAFARRSG